MSGDYCSKCGAPWAGPAGEHECDRSTTQPKAAADYWNWQHGCGPDSAHMAERRMGTDLVWDNDRGRRRWVRCVECGERLDTWT